MAARQLEWQWRHHLSLVKSDFHVDRRVGSGIGAMYLGMEYGLAQDSGRPTVLYTVLENIGVPNGHGNDIIISGST